MNLIKGALPYFLLPFVISLALVPFAKRIGLRLGIYAMENKRTVHHGKIVRIGGVAIYIAVLVSMTVLWRADLKLNGILIGASVIFIGGLLDDIYNLPPKVKILFQVAGAFATLFIGNLSLDTLHILSMEISNPIIVKGISFVWLIGITNAINLIDGLDGLSSGICTIVTMTIGILGFFMGRRDICVMALILSGAILGFLPYNFHPASIFVGDCGAQFMGFSIAAMSLLGFKTTALITLGLPILVLFIPISDTLIAIVRRKLKGQKITEADRGHLHHILMIKLKLGHRKTVEVLYVVTALFALAAIVTWFNPQLGIVMVFLLVLGADLFIEYTGMINPKFHPILSLVNRLTGWPAMENGEDPVDTIRREEEAQEARAAAEELKKEELKKEESKTEETKQEEENPAEEKADDEKNRPEEKKPEEKQPDEKKPEEKKNPAEENKKEEANPEHMAEPKKKRGRKKKQKDPEPRTDAPEKEEVKPGKPKKKEKKESKKEQKEEKSAD